MSHHATHLLLAFLHRLINDLGTKDIEVSEVIGDDEVTIGTKGKTIWLLDGNNCTVHVTIERY